MSDYAIKWRNRYASIDETERAQLRQAFNLLDEATMYINFNYQHDLTQSVKNTLAILYSYITDPDKPFYSGPYIMGYTTIKRECQTARYLLPARVNDEPKLLPLNDTNPNAVGHYVVIVFGHRQPVEIAASNGTHICVRLPGGHGVKWYTREQINLWKNEQEVQAA